MGKNAIQLPLTFIIFLIILIITVALLLLWNFSGISSLTNIFGSAGKVVNETSGGVVTSLVP